MTITQAPLVCGPPDPELQACVVIPVSPVSSDIAQIERVLESLATQTDALQRPWPPSHFEVILLSRDLSFTETSERVRQKYPRLRLHLANSLRSTGASQLRRAAMDEAYQRLDRVGASEGAILSTDPDATVANEWIAQNMAEVARGADAVGGRILLDNRQRDLYTRNLHQLEDHYRLLVSILESDYEPLDHDPLPRHHQHYPASFAVTAEAYAAINGFPVGGDGSSAWIYESLVNHDLRVRHSPAVQVSSPRISHDPNGGVFGQLGGCPVRPGEGERLPVESVAFLDAFLSARRHAQRVWKAAQTGSSIRLILTTPPVTELADLAGIPAHRIRDFLSEAPSFGRFLYWLRLRKRLEVQWRNLGRFEPLALAVEKLERRFQSCPIERKKINFAVRSIAVLGHL